MITQTLIQRRCVMKSYDELKAELETIQQQMAEASIRAVDKGMFGVGHKNDL